jgi:RNA polymerase sigma-70 factor (ECF subfamily)
MVSREVALQGDTSSQWGPGLPADTPSPSSHAAAHEDAAALQAALARLPEEYRRVLLLRHDEGRPFEEIGQLMDRTANAARKLWARALERLQQELGVPP